MIIAKVFGIEDALEAFRQLPMAVQNTGMRVALNAAGGVIRDAAVANAPKESGLLRKAIKVKVKVPNASYNRAHHGKPAYAIVGASRNIAGIQTYLKSGRRGRFKLVRVKRKNKQDRFERGLGVTVATTLRRPSRYSHLAGPKRKANFLQRAVASHGDAAKAKMIGKLHSTISEWAARRAAAARKVFKIAA